MKNYFFVVLMICSFCIIVKAESNLPIFKTASNGNGYVFKINKGSYVWPDGNVYSCERPGDDCPNKAIGKWGDLKFPVPTGGGMVGTTRFKGEKVHVWSDGTVYSCARPGDDCPNKPIGKIVMPKAVTFQSVVEESKALPQQEGSAQ